MRRHGMLRQKQRRPREAGVGPEMLSPAGLSFMACEATKEKRPLRGVGPGMLSPTG